MGCLVTGVLHSERRVTWEHARVIAVCVRRRGVFSPVCSLPIGFLL